MMKKELLDVLPRISKLPVIRPLIMTLVIIDDNPALCHITEKSTHELIRTLPENDLIG